MSLLQKIAIGYFVALMGAASINYIPGLTRSSQEIFKMLPYMVTILVLIAVSLRRRRENSPPTSLGLAYFREER